MRILEVIIREFCVFWVGWVLRLRRRERLFYIKNKVRGKG